MKKNYKREVVAEEGIRSYKIKHMRVSNSSGAKINVSYYRNGTGQVILGLNSHLDPNTIHWYCVMKSDCDYKNANTTRYLGSVF